MSGDGPASAVGVFLYEVPPWPLSRFVETLYSSSTPPGFLAGLERAERLPEVAAQLVFMVEDGCNYPAARRVRGSVHASVFLALGHLELVQIPLSVREVTAASLRPAGLPLVLPGSAAAWAGRERVALEEIMGQPARDLLEQMVEAAPGHARARTLQRFLQQRMHRVAAPNRLVSEALRLTSESQGALSVAELAERCGCSARRLHQLTMQTTGLSPKRLARIARTQHLLDVLMSSAKLTDAAH